MHQAFDEHVFELHEDAEVRDACDDAVEFVADLVEHEIAFQPSDGVPGGFVGPLARPLAVFTESLHVFQLVAEGFGLLVGERVLDGSMHEQIRVAPDG